MTTGQAKWLRRLGWVVGAWLVLSLLAWLALPLLVKSQAERRLGELLGRTVTIGRVEIAPWTLELTVRDFVVGPAPGATGASVEPLLRVARLHVDADARSLFRLAPVIAAIDVDTPELRIARTADGHYDIDDLIARLAPAQPAPPPSEPARFALYNLQVRDASLRFDDRPVGRTHLLSALHLAVPFVSNLPTLVDIKVEPRLAFRFNGTAFDTGAQTTPFAQTRRGTLQLAMGELDLLPYLPYLPESLPVRLKQGRVSADLTVDFQVPAGAAPSVSVRGKVGADDIAVDDRDGAELLGWKHLALDLRDVQPLARKLAFGTLSIDAPRLQASRDAHGGINLLRLAGPAPAASAVGAAPAASAAASRGAAASAPSATASAVPASPAAKAAPDWVVMLEALRVDGARIAWNDAAVAPAAALALDGVSLQAGPLRYPVEKPAPLKLAATLRPQAASAPDWGRLNADGEVSDRSAHVALALDALSLDALRPYLADALVPRLAGSVSAGGTVDWAAAGGTPAAAQKLTLSEGRVSVDDLRLSDAAGAAGKDAATAKGAKAGKPGADARPLGASTLAVTTRPDPNARTAKGARPAKGAAAPDAALASLKHLQVQGVEADLTARTARIASVKADAPAITVARDRQGAWNLLAWVPAAGASAPEPSPTGAKPARAGTAEPAAAAPWSLRLGDLAVTGGRLRFADDAQPAPVRVDLADLRLGVSGLALRGAHTEAPAKLQFGARVLDARDGADARGGSGLIEWKGQLGLEPLALRGTARLERLPVHAVEPYFGRLLNVRLVHAQAGYKGEVGVREGAAGFDVDASGDVLVADVEVQTRPAPGSAEAPEDLLRWQSFTLTGLKAALRPPHRPKVEIAEAALTDFYSRLVITEQGRFNLRDVQPVDGDAAAAPGPAGTASAPAATATSSSPATPATAATTATAATAATPAAAPASAPAVALAPAPGASSVAVPAAPPSPLPIDLVVGATRNAHGEVDFSDHFVRPNYSAKLTGLNGRVGSFRSGTSEMASLELHGRAAGTALLDIAGQLNPTVNPPLMDIRAKATDLELAPLSPYAGKYAGYAIERGKLSMDVAYKIEADGRLTASNQVILNQLTFGDKVDSPDATKLPVLLAVALLKDRHGVIDINLPISGSLQDPQFSVGGLIFKVIVNLLVKALTAPFSLLAGGGGEDLSVVEFRPGTALLSDSSGSALERVAKSLTERPALKMTVTGAADPASEGEAYRSAVLDARIVAERKKELARAGQASAEAPTLSDADRARLLKEVYKQTDIPNKPRNLLGLAKDLPAPEMEALLKSRMVVSTDAMRDLALQRGLAVRDALVARGLPSERLFLAAPKLRASDDPEGAWTPRVQLSLSTD